MGLIDEVKSRFFWARADKSPRSVKNGQNGFSLIEILVSLAIFGAIGVVFISGLITGEKGLMVSQERVAAESLAKSQVEYIKKQGYISVFNYDPGDPAKRYQVIDIPAHLTSAGYAVEINSPESITPAGRAGFELQSITIKVKRHRSGKLILTFYRTGLAL